MRCFMSLCIAKMIQNDYESIKSEYGIFYTGLKFRTIKGTTIISYLSIFFRYVITLTTLGASTIFLFTTNSDNDEAVLDQVKDFTCLVIIVKIDNDLVGYLDVRKHELDILEPLFTERHVR